LKPNGGEIEVFQPWGILFIAICDYKAKYKYILKITVRRQRIPEQDT